eukprot:Rhum_TRINITY_DN2105_c0_g1::Rhum_TRINITY_DN2105_c0_g1_i1::g.5945::m.5945
MHHVQMPNNGPLDQDNNDDTARSPCLGALCKPILTQAAADGEFTYTELREFGKRMSASTVLFLCRNAKREHEPTIIFHFDGVKRVCDHNGCCTDSDRLVSSNAARFRSDYHCAATVLHDLLALCVVLWKEGPRGRDMAEKLEPFAQEMSRLRNSQHGRYTKLASQVEGLKHFMDGEEERHSQSLRLWHQQAMFGLNRAERIARHSDKPQSQEKGETGTAFVTRLALEGCTFAQCVDAIFNYIASIRKEQKQLAHSMGRRLTAAARKYQACQKAQDAFRKAFSGVVVIDHKRCNLDQAVFSGGQYSFTKFCDAVDTLLRDLHAQDTMTSTLFVPHEDKEWLSVVDCFRQLRLDCMGSVRLIFDKYQQLDGMVKQLRDHYDAFQAGGAHGDSKARESVDRSTDVAVTTTKNSAVALKKAERDCDNTPVTEHEVKSEQSESSEPCSCWDGTPDKLREQQQLNNPVA